MQNKRNNLKQKKIQSTIKNTGNKTKGRWAASLS